MTEPEALRVRWREGQSGDVAEAVLYIAALIKRDRGPRPRARPHHRNKSIPAAKVALNTDAEGGPG